MRTKYSFRPNKSNKISKDSKKKVSLSDKGIYLIIIGNGVYIGKTTTSFRQRFLSHYTNLVSNSHYNDKCLDSFNKFKRCIFIPLINFKTKDELNNDLIITTLESYIISHFPIKDLLNNECKAPKANIVKLLNLNYSEVISKANDSILFIQELMDYNNYSLSNLIKDTKIESYRRFYINTKVKKSSNSLDVAPVILSNIND